MENKHKKNKRKSFLSYVIMGLIAACLVMLLIEISINTAAEFKAIQSYDNHSVVIDDPTLGK